MNKKGDLFMLGLDVLFLIALVMIFWRLSAEFAPSQYAEEIGTRQTALMSTYAVSEKMLLYIDTAATFAAYEAMDTIAASGIVNPVSNTCGSYAGYERWTEPGKNCFSTREIINEDFSNEFKRVLATFWNLPGLPGGIQYKVTVEQRPEGLAIVGVTDDRITLPIISAKRRPQSDAKNMIIDENIARVSRGTFAPDTDLPTIVRPDVNREPRSGAIETIIIFATGTAHVADTIAQYEASEGSVHFVIDARGEIFQHVPTADQANFCESDLCESYEDTAVSIALVHELNDEPYTKNQTDALVQLAAEIVNDEHMKPENVKLLSSITKEKNPGDKFLAERTLITRITSESNKQQLPTPQEENQPDNQDTGLITTWPTSLKTVNSCYGPRPNIGDGFHDGIDMPGAGLPVYAFADGIVLETCTGHCSGFGNNVLIEHANGLKSRYNHLSKLTVRKTERVTRGDRIGTSGSTGSVTGAHLDFKVYPGAIGKDTGKNPLCYFAESDLQQLTFTGSTCGFKKLSRHDPVFLKMCEGVDAPGGSDAGGCFFTVTDVSGSPQVSATLKNIIAQPDVYNSLKNAAEEYDVELSFMIAIIAQETCLNPLEEKCGTANLVSNTGCAGLGQFCRSTAESPTFKPIFGNNIKQCTCPISGRSCTEAQAGCQGDARFDPVKSARAIGLLLRENLNHYPDKDDRVRFAIATYNAGPSIVKKAIARTGKPNPTWEEVASVLDESVVKEAYQGTSIYSYFDTPEEQREKARQVKTYVERVSGYYAAQGGSLSGYADQTCGDQQVPVKELGSYSFTPSFSVAVPDALSPAERLVTWARETYDQCNGETDTRACLAERKKLNINGVSFVSCDAVEGDESVGVRFRGFVSDCKENPQEDCYCEWYPNQDVDIQLFGEIPHVFVNGNPITDIPDGAPLVQYEADGKEQQGLVSLRKKQLVVWDGPVNEEGATSPFEKERQAYDVELFMLRDDMTWLTDAKDMQACGVFKTHHNVCAKITTPTYSLTQGKTKDPLVKFSLYLDDRVDPVPITTATATRKTTSLSGITVATESLIPIDISFDPSTSDDVSYYTVSCVGMEDDKETILARNVDDKGVDTKITTALTTQLECKLPTTVVQIVITTHDISGRTSVSAPFQAQNIDTATITT